MTTPIEIAARRDGRRRIAARGGRAGPRMLERSDRRGTSSSSSSRRLFDCGRGSGALGRDAAGAGVDLAVAAGDATGCVALRLPLGAMLVGSSEVPGVMDSERAIVMDSFEARVRDFADTRDESVSAAGSALEENPSGSTCSRSRVVSTSACRSLATRDGFCRMMGFLLCLALP